MNRELSSPEIEKQLMLQQLKQEYLEAKRWADYGFRKGYPEMIDVMERRAKGAMDEIVKIDPNFPQQLAGLVGNSFVSEASELNREQYDRPDYKDQN